MSESPLAFKDKIIKEMSRADCPEVNGNVLSHRSLAILARLIARRLQVEHLSQQNLNAPVEYRDQETDKHDDEP